MNITGEFWTNNLLEPLLISYCITVMVVYLLASNINNIFTKYFRMFFPKVLVFVVLFQTISSLMRIRDIGITYGRYYVILFGIFAIIAGIIFSILPVRKNGLIAPILIVLAAISILWPVDAFTISKINQTSRLEKALIRNQMLKGETIESNSELKESDRDIIISSVQYLDRMGETKDIIWLSSYHASGDFEGTFGFAEYPSDKGITRNISVTRDGSTPIPIAGYEYMMIRSITNHSMDEQLSEFEENGVNYSLLIDRSEADNPNILLMEEGEEILRFETDRIFNKFGSENNSIRNTKDMTFTEENSKAIMSIIVQYVSINEWDNGIDSYADVYFLVHIK